MKKFLRILAGAVLAASMSLAPRVMVGAQTSSSCNISNTGTDSFNSCTFDNNKNLTLECKNGITVTTDNNQSANSGTVVVDNNGNVGGVSSGNATNDSQTVANLAAHCGQVAATNPPAGGQGGGVTDSGAPAQPAGGQGAGAVTALPRTGTSDIVRNVGLATLATGALGAGAHFALSAYRRRVFNL